VKLPSGKSVVVLGECRCTDLTYNSMKESQRVVGVVVQVTMSQGRLHWLPNCRGLKTQRKGVASSMLTSRSETSTEMVSNKDDVIELSGDLIGAYVYKI